MELTASTIIFYILAAVIGVFSVMTVTSSKILRSATYLLFVLLGTAGLYLMLNYHFVAAVQVSVYAGGIVVLYVFGIMLTSTKGDKIQRPGIKKKMLGISAVVLGLVLTLLVIFGGTVFGGMETDLIAQSATPQIAEAEINMKDIGMALMGSGKNQYVLPFEAISVLLLACIIGGLLIARKR